MLRMIVIAAWIFVLVSSCGHYSDFWAVNANRYSAQVTGRFGSKTLITRNLLVGEAAAVSVAFGDPVLLATFKNYSLRLIPTTADGTRVQSPAKFCAGHFALSSFDSVISRMTLYLERSPTVSSVHFEVVPFPRNTRYRSKVETKIGSSLPVRFAFPIPEGTSDCRSWWLHTLNILVHEYVHVHLGLTETQTFNILSEEVTAYSIARCSLLATATPGELGLTTFDLRGVDVPFEEIYGSILSSESANAGLRGRGLADLHLFELLGRTIPESLSPGQQQIIDSFCRRVTATPIDFTEQPYNKVVASLNY